MVVVLVNDVELVVPYSSYKEMLLLLLLLGWYCWLMV